VFFSENFLSLLSILVAPLKDSYVVVMVTASNKQEAEKITQKLLEEKLIACANILGPVSSHFHWAGKIDKAEEYLLFMKSRSDLFDAVSAKVKTLHSYEVPEVLALPILKGSKAYLDWLNGVLK
jgi:periplasmic divalent cation tolerance protein